MRIVLQKGFRRYEVVERHESCTGHSLLQFRDRASALDFLLPLIRDSLNMGNIRRLLHRFSHYGNISGLNDQQVLEQFAWQLVSRQFKISELPIFEMGPSTAEPSEEYTEPEPELIPKIKEKTWIEIELLYENDEPVAGAQYRIVLPDGASVATGTTDKNGLARIDDIDPGMCQIRFPTLDQDAKGSG